MTAKTKKQKKKKVFDCDPEFAQQWADSQIDLTKSSTKLVKLLQKKSAHEASYSQSPLTWFVDELANGDAVEKIDFWYQTLLSQTELRQHFVDIGEATERITNLGPDSPADSAASELGLSDALTALAACHSLRAVAGNSPYLEWNGLVTRLLELAKAAEANVGLAAPVYQILAIEIPLTIAFQVPEIEDHRQVATRCCHKLEVFVEDMLDHDGWPHARYLDEFGLLAASWVRCGMLLRKMKIELDPELSSQLEWVVRQIIRMTGPDGRLVFADRSQRRFNDDLGYCLAKLSSDDVDERLLKLRRSSADAGVVETPKSKSGKSKSKKASSKKANSKKLPPVSCNSDWGESGVLRSHWGAESPQVGFDYSDTSIRMSIARSVKLISGIAMPEISINSVAVVADRDLEVVCEQSDEDVEYVELETDLGEGAVFNRQILLSRDEEFLLIADIIVPREASKIEYRCDYPLASGIVGMRETENREIYLRTSEIRSLVLPLALPEWKTGRSDDRLEVDDSKLSLVQNIEGGGLYAPLFFDLNPKRSRQKRTWRQLTVGENLQSVPRDVACAYRVQLDQQQWCFYRAITSSGNRTFLGENIIAEFVFNRFKKDGTVTPLLVI